MKDTNINFLRPHQVEILTEEKRRLQADQFNPYVKDKSGASKQVRQIDKMLRDQAPEELPKDEQDKCRKEAMDILEQKILPGMLTVEEMRRSSSDKVYRHMRWEKQAKPSIMKFKNLMLQASAGTPDAENPDLCNIERYRPHSKEYRYDSNAFVPGHFAQSSQSKENWPLGDPKVETAVAQAEKNFGERMAEKRAEKKHTQAST